MSHATPCGGKREPIMDRKLISDTVIPACYGRAFELTRGQVLRIHLPEGKQVGDCVFFNANDYREQFHVGQSWLINQFAGTGTATIRYRMGGRRCTHPPERAFGTTVAFNIE